MTPVRVTQETEDLLRQARHHAHSFLRRFDDPVTRSECDDIAQDSAIAAWQWADAVREPQRFAAAVRTIARRKRCRALRDHYRRRAEEQSAGVVGDHTETETFLVAGRWVPREWLVSRLQRSIGRLRAIDRCILLAIQEGFCGAEIADRYSLTEHNVKVRTYRARRRVRTEIEEAVRMAALDDFDSRFEGDKR